MIALKPKKRLTRTPAIMSGAAAGSAMLFRYLLRLKPSTSATSCNSGGTAVNGPGEFDGTHQRDALFTPNLGLNSHNSTLRPLKSGSPSTFRRPRLAAA